MSGLTPWEYFRVEAAIGYAPDDSNPQWTDLTPWVDSVAGPISIQTGRPTEQTTAEPSSISITFNNTDHRFTFGNLSSPLSPYWRQALKVRVYEVIGYKRFPLFTGWLEEPVIDDWAPQGIDQQITVTLVDRLIRIDRSHTFIGTLAEYILYNGGSSLAGYWPCNDPSAPFLDVTGKSPSLGQVGIGLGGVQVTQQSPLLLAGSGSAVLGDDGATSVLQAGIGVNGSGNNIVAQIPDVRVQWGITQPNLTIPAGQVLTVVIWLNGNPPPDPRDLSTFGFGISTANASILGSVDPDGLVGATVSGNFTGSGTAGPFPTTGWMPLTIRYGWSPAVFEMWIGQSRTVFSLTGSPGASDQLFSIRLPQMQCGFGHLQLYLDTASAWDLPQMAAQMQAARSGLSGQYTGQRIQTMALYAGVPVSELSNVDNGVAMMGPAKLAGSTPFAQMQVAETTEQGRLYANGDGLIVFQDRNRRYNR